jgi:hypothetical protein
MIGRAAIAAVNFHPGPPNYRGTGCVNFALYDGADAYGCTSHLLAPEIEKRKTLPSSESDPPIEPVRRVEDSGPASGQALPKSKQATGKDVDRELASPPKKRGPKTTSTQSSKRVSPPNRDLVPPQSTADVDDLSPSLEDVVEPEVVPSEAAEDSDTERVQEEQSASAVDDSKTSGADPIDHLLPPRFDVLDPARMRLNMGQDQFKVFLPDGKGGTKQFDRRLMRVEHDGEKVELVAMTEKQRQRRRLIQNIIAVIIGIIILTIAFSLLR